MGSVGVSSVAPPLDTATLGYRFPLEKTTIRLSLNRSATRLGSQAFMAQVAHSFPTVPNFFPAIKMIFSASGRCSTAPGASRSALIMSTPFWRSRSVTRGSVNRDTAITRLSAPAERIAFLASTQRVGPIFPPAPRTMISPSSPARSRTSAALGVVSILFSFASVHIVVCSFVIAYLFPEDPAYTQNIRFSGISLGRSPSALHRERSLKRADPFIRDQLMAHGGGMDSVDQPVGGRGVL